MVEASWVRLDVAGTTVEVQEALVRGGWRLDWQGREEAHWCLAALGLVVREGGGVWHVLAGAEANGAGYAPAPPTFLEHD